MNGSANLAKSLLLSLINLSLWRYAPPSARAPLAISQLGLTIGLLTKRHSQTFHMFSVAHLAMHSYLGILIHEQGHALAMRACLKAVKPEIHIDFFGEGLTYPMGAVGPTQFAEWLGTRRANLLIVASGLLASTTSAMLLAFSGQKYQCQMLNHLAFWQLTLELIYASRNGQDLVAIRTHGGPSRLTIALTMISLALFVKSITWAFFSSNRPSQETSHPQLLQRLERA